jgi:hypothetical protein
MFVRMSVGVRPEFRAGPEEARAAIERAGDARVLVIDLRELTSMDTSGVHRGLTALGLEREFTFVHAP